MSRANSGDYISGLFHAIKKELEDIGIHVQSVDVTREEQYGYVTHNSAYSPINMREPATIIDITFLCKEEELKYLRPYISDVELFEKNTYLPVDIFSKYGSNPTRVERIEVEVIHKCKMRVHATGGSYTDFIERFREDTAKLRYAIESKKFDDEVEKLLTNSDEYNN